MRKMFRGFRARVLLPVAIAFVLMLGMSSHSAPGAHDAGQANAGMHLAKKAQAAAPEQQRVCVLAALALAALMVLDLWPGRGSRSAQPTAALMGVVAEQSGGAPAVRGGTGAGADDGPRPEAAQTRFQAAAEASLDALFIARCVRADTGQIVDFEFSDINARAEEMLGAPRAWIVGHTFCELLPVMRSNGLFDKCVQVVLTGAPLEEEFPLDTPEARKQWLRHQVVRVDDGIAISSRDITKWKEAGARLRESELALTRSNRALRTLSACNAALIHAVSEPELLDTICRLIVDAGGYSMAWVGFAEQDPGKTVRVVAQCGSDEDYLATRQLTWADTEYGRGPTGTAIRTGATQVNQSYLTNPRMAPWRAAALARGFQASIALPLNSQSRIYGALTLYARESDAFNEDEVRLLQELADDLAFGITTLRTRAERDRIALEHQRHEELLRKSLDDSIQLVSDTVEMRDPYTAGHQRRVGELAVAIARGMGLSDEEIHGIHLAASIHDLGKVQVPAEILAKPSALSAVEFMLIKAHAQAGYNILKGIEFPWPIANIVLQHHERQDGSGYPKGLKGNQILLGSRIIAVADVLEAMASHRPYRPALGIDLALAEIKRGQGSAYDPAIVDTCLELFRERRFAFLDAGMAQEPGTAAWQ